MCSLRLFILKKFLCWEDGVLHEATEEKCSWSLVLLKWWCHQKQVHQKHLIRSRRSPEAEVHQEMQDLKLQRLFNGFNFVKALQQSEATTILKGFESIRCLFFGERWQSTIVRSVQPLPPLLCFCLCYRTRITALPATMFPLNWNGIWNWSFIGQ